MWAVLLCAVCLVSGGDGYYRKWTGKRMMTASRKVATQSVPAKLGDAAQLPCTMDLDVCGQFHSVKWYKASSRLWLLNHEGKSKPEGNVANRMTMEYNNSSKSGAFLKINDVQLEDEATYKCEITYLEVKEQCEVIQFVKLVVLVTPQNISMRTSDNETLMNASVLGPKEEGDEVALICEAKEGKPIPKVRWFNGTTEVTRAIYTADDPDGDGVGTGTSILRLRITRWDLNARFECRVESEALKPTTVLWITTEVHVRPTKMELSGVKNHVVQGTNVLLICDVFGARPPATVRWVNGSTPITNQSLVQSSPEDNAHLRTSIREEIVTTSTTIEDRDGTFTTKSQLVFQATHWENGQTIHCYAENNVTKNHKEPELHELLVMEVRYPPVITVLEQYKNITINESTLDKPKSQLLDCKYIANPQKLEDVMWSKDGKNLTLNDKNKYEGGDTTNLQLIIHNVTRDDMGEYYCYLKNEVGTEHSEDALFLNVQYPPEVEIIMDPSTPVKAIDKKTVIFLCNVTSGNPSTLTRVKWYANGSLLNELPQCNYSSYDEDGNGIGNGGSLCNVDPTLLSLERVDQNFSGNYTCRGMNAAGWGPKAEPQELIVYYPPSTAVVRYYPSQVIKGGVVTLECSVRDPGIPSDNKFIWMRGSHRMSEHVSNFTINPVRLETRSNFTCIAQNEGGESEPGTVFINVSAPPAFINKLPTYQGILYTAEHINLTCRVECSPLCAIVWKKNGVVINTNNNNQYYVKTNTYPPDKSKNDFESIESTLIWNMTDGRRLDKSDISSNYTCQSMSNSIGRGVDSTIEIAIDYPPDDIEVKPQIVDVVEGRVPPAVRCHGKGHPALTYQWKRSGAVDSAPTSSSGEELRLGVVRRTDSGAYICEASNKHGTAEAKVYINVQYAPECALKKTTKDGNSVLLCTAEANPQEVIFTWKIKEFNETFEERGNIITETAKSYFILDDSIDVFRTYYCYANNTVGMSTACEMDVQGNLPWYQRMDRDKLIVIIASIVAIIICVIIICIVIIVLCRRKRTDAKYNSSLEMEEREKPDGHSPSNGDQAKWPLKPGVLVHVSKMNNISISQLSARSSPFKTTSVSTTTAYLKYRRNKNKVYARLERLRQSLGLGRSSDHVPFGIKESASGVVTFKKFRSSSPTIVTEQDTINPRKRKKPGLAPNQFSTAGDRMNSASAPVSGAEKPGAHPGQDTHPDDKGFYENLPFHGIQNPPNKPISIIAPFNQPSFVPTKSLVPSQQGNASFGFPQTNPKISAVKRNQSFHGFQNTFNQPPHPLFPHLPMFYFSKNFSNPYLTQGAPPQSVTNLQFSSNFLPAVSQHLNTISNPKFDIKTPNPFNVMTSPRIVGRNETQFDIRRSASGINKNSDDTNSKNTIKKPKHTIIFDKQFGSLEIKKHKCYSPIFYSMRCKKHAKKRPVIYALPKKCTNKSKSSESSATIFTTNSSNNPLTSTDGGFENLSDSIQISEEVSEKKEQPKPAPRCKKHRDKIYANIPINHTPSESNKSLNSSTESPQNVHDVSTTEAQVHVSNSDIKTKEPTNVENEPKTKIISATPKPKNIHLINLSPTGMKNSPTLKVSPNFVKPKTQSPKGALSLQIQAKLKASPVQSPSDNPSTSILTKKCPNNEEEIPVPVENIPPMPIIDMQARKSPKANSVAVAVSKAEQAYRPDPCEMDYADADYRSVYAYGPINYKAASVYAAMKRNRQENNRLEEVDDKQDLL